MLSVMPDIDVSVETISSANYYEDMTVVKADEDGTYDYIRITDCNTSLTAVEIPSELAGLPETVEKVRICI